MACWINAIPVCRSSGKNLSTQQSALDLRVENVTKTLTAKYNAMDLLVGQMKATASNITSVLHCPERAEVQQLTWAGDRNPATPSGVRRVFVFCPKVFGVAGDTLVIRVIVAMRYNMNPMLALRQYQK